MTHRRIRDVVGKSWDVWAVNPSDVERRMSGEHRIPVIGAEEDDGARREIRVVVPTGLQDGWLAFQTGIERRRLAPIPDGWHLLTEAQLLELLEQAISL